jgi:hypothetical protein
LPTLLAAVWRHCGEAGVTWPSSLLHNPSVYICHLAMGTCLPQCCIVTSMVWLGMARQSSTQHEENTALSRYVITTFTEVPPITLLRKSVTIFIKLVWITCI